MVWIDYAIIGIVGFSDRARYALIPAMQVHAKEMNFEFTAVSDLWSRRRDECQAFVKEKTGLSIAACRNNDELYDRKDVDVVIISTADFQHALHCKPLLGSQSTPPAGISARCLVFNVHFPSAGQREAQPA